MDINNTNSVSNTNDTNTAVPSAQTGAYGTQSTPTGAYGTQSAQQGTVSAQSGAYGTQTGGNGTQSGNGYASYYVPQPAAVDPKQAKKNAKKAKKAQKAAQKQAKKAAKRARKGNSSGAKFFIGALIGLAVGLFLAFGIKLIGNSFKFVSKYLPEKKVTWQFGIIGNSDEDDDAGKTEENKDNAEANVKEVDSNFEENELIDEEIPAEDRIATTGDKKGSRVLKTDSITVVTDVTEVVKATMPAVVAVNNKFTTKVDFFGQVYSQENEAAGSGIIVGQNDTELLIATNAHVIEDADELVVTFVDDKQVPALIKGYDTDKDLAVIAVQISEIEKDTKDSIAIAELGDSEALTVGEPVIAIGNSLGYGQSVTTGVVSALHRVLGAAYTSEGVPTNEDNAPTFIQTDAAINPGNSGGALLNSAGQVIGINSNKLGGAVVEGMGYAIPISDAIPIIEELMTKQTKLKVDEASKGFLGITGIDVEKEYSEIYGMPEGVYVSSVLEGSGADEAGLVKGDIIVEINGDKVKGMDELRKQLGYYSVGTTVELTIMQGSPTGYKPKTVEVTLTEQQQQTENVDE